MDFLVGEFTGTRKEKGLTLSPVQLWLIAGSREVNLQILGSHSLRGRRNAGGVLCSRNRGKHVSGGREELSDASD